MAEDKITTTIEDIERILGDSIIDKNVLDDKVKIIREYIDKTVRDHMRINIALMLSTIYDNDDTQLEADLVRLEMFNPDKKNICETAKNRVGALNAVLPLITHYFDSYADLCNKIERPYAEIGKLHIGLYEI